MVIKLHLFKNKIYKNSSYKLFPYFQTASVCDAWKKNLSIVARYPKYNEARTISSKPNLFSTSFQRKKHRSNLKNFRPPYIEANNCT